MARKVLISLVGGQPLPIYLEAKEVKPDILLLIHSKDTETIAATLEQMLTNHLPGSAITKQPLSTTNHLEANAFIKAIADQWCNDDNEVIVNLIGGTKHWSLMFFNHFKGRAKCVLIDQNNVVTDIETLETTAIQPKITIDELFALNDVKANVVDFADYSSEDLQCARDIEELRNLNPTAFKTITTMLKDNPDAIESESKCCRIECDSKRERFSCHFQANIKGKHICINRVLTSQYVQQMLLNFGWFEVKVAQLLSKWPDAMHVWLNGVIKYDVSENDINELDIIVETYTHKWLFVECKTAIFSGPDIDKFNDVVRKYSGIASQKIFVTQWPIPENRADLSKRLEKSRIPHFSVSLIERNPSAFYNRLSQIMQTINAR